MRVEVEDDRQGNVVTAPAISKQAMRRLHNADDQNGGRIDGWVHNRLKLQQEAVASEKLRRIESESTDGWRTTEMSHTTHNHKRDDTYSTMLMSEWPIIHEWSEEFGCNGTAVVKVASRHNPSFTPTHRSLCSCTVFYCTASLLADKIVA